MHGPIAVWWGTTVNGRAARAAREASRLRALIEEGIGSGEIPAEKVFSDLRAEANTTVFNLA
jgi:hypothetical protein